MSDNAMLQSIGGQAAPAQAKQYSGSAAPGSNATSAGKPSSPSLEDAIVAEKKKAEHWKQKYERDVGDLRDSYSKLEAKLDGLTLGAQVNGQQPHKAAPQSFADLDDSGLDEIVRKGIEESNPGFVTAAAREMARREAAKEAKASDERNRAHLQSVIEEQRVYARISSEFGQDALNKESDLSMLADQYARGLTRNDPDAIRKNPQLAYLCFAQAEREMRQGERAELDQFKKAEAERVARAEVERGRQAIASKARDDVKEHLDRFAQTRDKTDFKTALKKRLGGMRAFGD